MPGVGDQFGAHARNSLLDAQQARGDRTRSPAPRPPPVRQRARAASRSINRSGRWRSLISTSRPMPAGPRRGQRLGQGRNFACRQKPGVEPRAGVEPAQGREVVVRDAAPAVGSAIKDLVMQQHDLIVLRQDDVDLADRGTALAPPPAKPARYSRARQHCGRDGRRHGCGRLRRRAGDRATGLPQAGVTVTASASWSEMAVPSGATAAMIAGSVHRRPRANSQSILPKGGAGVPSGLVRWVGARPRCSSPSRSRAAAAGRTSARGRIGATSRSGSAASAAATTAGLILVGQGEGVGVEIAGDQDGRSRAHGVDGVEQRARLLEAVGRVAVALVVGGDEQHRRPGDRDLGHQRDPAAHPALAEPPIEPTARGLEPGQRGSLQAVPRQDGAAMQPGHDCSGRHARPRSRASPSPSSTNSTPNA